MKNRKPRKKDSTEHLKNVFMDIPVVSSTESTGSGTFIKETICEEKIKSISDNQSGNTKIKDKKK